MASQKGASLAVALLWLAAGFAVLAGYRLNVALGGRILSPSEYPFSFAVNALTAASVPAIAFGSRRMAQAGVRLGHAFALHLLFAVFLSYLLLATHKLVFCPELECMTNFFVLEPWVGYWVASGVARYGVTAVAIALLDSAAAFRARAVRAARQERELATAELQLINAIVQPRYLQSAFGAIATRIDGFPEQAEAMIGAFADYLRLNVRAIGAEAFSLRDDLELARAWAAIEAQTREATVSLSVAVPQSLLDTPLAAPMVVTALNSLPSAGPLFVTVTSELIAQAIAITVDASDGTRHRFRIPYEEAA